MTGQPCPGSPDNAAVVLDHRRLPGLTAARCVCVCFPCSSARMPVCRRLLECLQSRTESGELTGGPRVRTPMRVRGRTGRRDGRPSSFSPNACVCVQLGRSLPERLVSAGLVERSTLDDLDQSAQPPRLRKPTLISEPRHKMAPF